jgi:hypothetical protein
MPFILTCDRLSSTCRANRNIWKQYDRIKLPGRSASATKVPAAIMLYYQTFSPVRRQFHGALGFEENVIAST